ncbi:unnamed protein product [Candida verbasci]|uniref:Uncharacterized protein n=1 Tax=Candida verbasci TaxID=1227364 RepID=A0A9W4TU48_9ASCO|nr:unnamed protein product [Candida verbasci]
MSRQCLLKPSTSLITTKISYHYKVNNSIFIIGTRSKSSKSTVTTNPESIDNSKFEIHNEKQLPPPTLDKNSIYIISLPITTLKSFVYCNHQPSLLSSKSSDLNNKVPLLLKLEHKVVNLAKKGWTKLSTSKSNINIKITSFIKKLLLTIPYEENCLTSFPNKHAMIREINKELKENDNNNLTIQSEIEKLKIPNDQLKPIPFYHANFQNLTTILNQLYKFKSENEEKHKKFAILCAIGIPLTLPFALVPVLPNVPGFYLAYRLYCHIKALLGIKHLNYLLEKKENNHVEPKSEEIANEKTVTDTSHIKFKVIEEIDKIYKENNENLSNLVKDLNAEELQPDDENEQLIINKEIINELTEKLDLYHIKDDLLKALSQESKKLNKNIKIEETVE